MIGSKKDLIRDELEQGTGARIGAEVDSDGLQKGVLIWFDDLGRNKGPELTLRPEGLKRHGVSVEFGTFAMETIRQMQSADQEAVQLSRALIQTVSRTARVEILPSQSLDDWKISEVDFRISAEVRGIDDPRSDDAIVETCRTVAAPVMAAMAELIGYEEGGEEVVVDHEPAMEGMIRQTVVAHRERSPRNRLLCLREHGTTCVVCGVDPDEKYRRAGSVIEVHHLQPLALNDEPRPYDPSTDLVPLCPGCHRAVHTRRPVPLTPEELKALIGE